MKVKIDYDGTNVRLTIETGISTLGKTVMILFNIIGICLILMALEEWLLSLLIIGILWTIFFGWLALWKLFGQELVIINKKSLSYQHRYGFNKTILESRDIRKALNISLIPAPEYHGEKYFHLIFESFNKQNHPEEIYRSTLPISETDLDVLKKSIRKLYFKKVDPASLNQPYRLN